MKATSTLITLCCIVITSLVFTMGCEMPMDVGRDVTDPGSHNWVTHDLSENAITIMDDGESMPAAMNGDGIVMSNPGDNRVEMVVTGSASFDHAQVRSLRLNVRQTAGGATMGGGEVMLRSPLSGQEHTTTFEASCVKPVTGWGRTNYGITLVLDNPFAPYGSMKYSHVAVSLTPDGHVAGLVLNTRDFCGGTILRDQVENRLSGNVVVRFPGV